MTTWLCRVGLVAAGMCLAVPLGAQRTEAQELQRFADRESRDFGRFVAAEDSAFASFLDREWRAYQAFASGSAYRAPKLVAPPRVPPASAAAPSAGGTAIVAEPRGLPPTPALRSTTLMVQRPAPVALLARRDSSAPPLLPSSLRTAAVPFFGGPVPVRYRRSPIPALAAPVSGPAIAAFFRELAAADWDVLADDLRQQSEALELDDYAYAQFVLRLGRVLAGDENRARLLTWYLLLKSNVDVRVGYLAADGALPAGTIVVLVPSSVVVYATPYFTFGAQRYYAVSLDAAPPPARVGSLYTYDGQYPGAPRAADLRIRKAPALTPALERRTLRWREGTTEHQLTVQTDRSAVQYLEWFPQVDWDVWFGIRMSEAARQSLLPPLRSMLAGRSEQDAVNFLLHFVQSAFAYKTDGDQFGREKPLSVDETLWYPYSDCEDRAILFAALVRELLGLDLVGLLYPGHMATAVRLQQPASGDVIVIGDTRWVVSDPTYIGADVGMAMLQYKSVRPEVIRIP